MGKSLLYRNTAPGQRYILHLVDGGLVLYQWLAEHLAVGCVFFEDTEDLVIEEFEHSNAFNHSLQRLREMCEGTVYRWNEDVLTRYTRMHTHTALTTPCNSASCLSTAWTLSRW